MPQQAEAELPAAEAEGKSLATSAPKRCRRDEKVRSKRSTSYGALTVPAVLLKTLQDTSRETWRPQVVTSQ